MKGKLRGSNIQLIETPAKEYKVNDQEVILERQKFRIIQLEQKCFHINSLTIKNNNKYTSIPRYFVS